MKNIVKTSKTSNKQPQLTLVVFPSDKSLCVVTCLKEYLDRTSNLRKSRSLFISCLKQHEAISLNTLSWRPPCRTLGLIQINLKHIALELPLHQQLKV